MSTNNKVTPIDPLTALRKRLDELYNEDYVINTYEKLGNMEVHLDPDPLEFGPLRLNGKIARCRQYQQECQKFEIIFSQLTSRLKSLQREVEVDYDLQKGNLLMNDVTVRSGRSITEREAFADRKLLKERRLIGDVERAQDSISMLLRVVKAKKADLKDASARIRDQYKIIQEAIACEGARWRNKSAPKVELNPAQSSSTVQVGSNMQQVLDPIVDAVQSLTEETTEEQTPNKKPTNKPELSVVAVSDDEMDGFLDDLLDDDDDGVTQKFDLSRSIGDLSGVRF